MYDDNDKNRKSLTNDKQLMSVLLILRWKCMMAASCAVHCLSMRRHINITKMKEQTNRQTDKRQTETVLFLLDAASIKKM